MKTRKNDFYIDTESCGCHECSLRVQQGHFACATVSESMLRHEAAETVLRIYEDGVWRWIFTPFAPKRGA